MLTEKQIFEYVDKVEDEGSHCPYCKSDQVEGSSITVEGNHAYQEMSCADCDETWDDMYRLVSIQEHGKKQEASST